MSRTFLSIAMVLSFVTASTPDLVPTTGSSLAEAANVVDLQGRLEKDLKARLPREFAFIKQVVDLARKDILPLSVVNSTHLWARKKPQRKFQYFEAAMRVRASRLGIAL